MVTLDAFIRRGYFRDELPPPFNTESLADALPQIIDNFPNPPRSTSKLCRHSIPKTGQFRRQLSIPNPLHQILLCKCLTENWDVLKDHCSSSQLSLSKPIIDSNNKRALVRPHQKSELKEQRAIYSKGFRYRLRTDISRFYPTIYTHIIPWALHTKEVAKMERQNTELVGNKIDTCVRNIQDAQTNGIPIGPDSSILISEIVGTAIDKKLTESNQLDSARGFRYVDDFYIYFRSHSEAECALSELHRIVSEFELELNPEKTEIIQLPESLESKWVTKLSLHRLRRVEKNQHTDLMRYFSTAFECSKLYPKDSVLKYALIRTQNERIKEGNWPLYESFILQSMMVDSRVLPIATEILLTYSDLDYGLDLPKVIETIKEIISYHGSLNNDYELAWSLWLCKTLNIGIDEETANIISNIEDCVVALIALDLHNMGLISTGLELDKWNSIMTKEELYGENWLLAYEANVKEWLDSVESGDHVANDGFFSLLKENNVEFYDTTQRLTVVDIEDYETEPDETVLIEGE